MHQVLEVQRVKPPYQVNRKIIGSSFSLKNDLICVECGDAAIKCVNAECVNTGHEDLPVYCQCYDGTRRDPRKNDTCPQSLLFFLSKSSSIILVFYLGPCYEPNTETPICQNGGTCQIYNSAPVCQCKDGYAGQVCDKTLKSIVYRFNYYSQ